MGLFDILSNVVGTFLGLGSGLGCEGCSGSGEAQTYTIQAGDTLTSIAAAHNTSVEALLSANPSIEDPDMIVEGETLTIPASAADGIAKGEPAAHWSCKRGSRCPAYPPKHGRAVHAVALLQGGVIRSMLHLPRDWGQLASKRGYVLALPQAAATDLLWAASHHGSMSGCCCIARKLWLRVGGLQAWQVGPHSLVICMHAVGI
jgi:LysM repeat protein